MLKKNSTGFTLMELLIVLIIMGVLAATGIATYTRAVERKKGEVTANNIRMIMAAWKIYNSKQIAGDEYDPASYVPINDLNNDLGIIIDERNFGDVSVPEAAFSLDWHADSNPATDDYDIRTRRLSGTHSNHYIHCIYENGTYDWYDVIAGANWFDTFPDPDN